MANVTTWEFIVGLLYILGGLGIFLFGMRVMSEGIQKVAGEGMRRIMATMTQNRFFGLGTGLLVTCLGPVFLGYYRNGGEFCKRSASYFDGIYRSYHGGKPWYHTYRLDYCYNWKV